MRRIIASFVLTTVAAVSAPGELVNGTFDEGAVSKIADVRSFGAIGKGWYVGTTGAQQVEFSRRSVRFSSVASGSPRLAAIGQLFTCSAVGPQLLEFDVTVADSNSNLTFTLQLFGYTQRTREKTILFGNALKLDRTDDPVTSDYYKVTRLVNVRGLSANDGETRSVEFTASKDYAFYGIRIMAVCPDTGDQVVLDAVRIIPAPAE